MVLVLRSGPYAIGIRRPVQHAEQVEPRSIRTDRVAPKESCEWIHAKVYSLVDGMCINEIPVHDHVRHDRIPPSRIWSHGGDGLAEGRWSAPLANDQFNRDRRPGLDHSGSIGRSTTGNVAANGDGELVAFRNVVRGDLNAGDRLPMAEHLHCANTSANG